MYKILNNYLNFVSSLKFLPMEKKFKECLTLLSGNELHEINGLIWKIKNSIQDYNHVSEYLPESLIKNIEKVAKAIDNEFTKRENI